MIAAVDLGSVRAGAVCASRELPLNVLGRDTVPVDGDDLGVTVDRIMALTMRCYDGKSPLEMLLELGTFYVDKDASDAGKAATARAYAVMCRLHERLLIICEERRIAAQTVSRAAWSHRLVPHTRGGIGDRQVNEALQHVVTPESWALLETQDERDAAGLILWALTPAPKRPNRKRSGEARAPRVLLTEEQKREHQRRWSRDGAVRSAAAKLVARQAAGCTCPRKHRRGCPLFVGSFKLHAWLLYGFPE